MKALIAGATGLVGHALVEALVQSGYYQDIVVLVRRKGIFSNPKVTELLFNYDDPDQLESLFDDVYICLGTTIKKAGSKDAFRKVDLEYVRLIGAIAEQCSAKTLQVISAAGANAKSSNFYLSVKGEMEESLSRKRIPSINVFRPSLILGDRKEFRFGEWLGTIVLKVLNPFLNGRLKMYKPVEATLIAKAMFLSAKARTNGMHVIDNKSILSCEEV